MATPLSTRGILLAKWWSAFRVVPALAILPASLAFIVGMNGRGLIAAIAFSALITAVVLAYGAAVTSAGIALAAWQANLGRAVRANVSLYLAATVIYPAILATYGRPDPTLLWVSPFFGIHVPFVSFAYKGDFRLANGILLFVWAATTALAAYAILRATIASFDRLLGRMPEIPRRRSRFPVPRPPEPAHSTRQPQTAR